MNALKFTIACALLVAGSSHAAGNLSVTREVIIDSTPATVWKLVGNFNALDVWHPAVSKSELNGAGTKVGTRRLLTLVDSKKTIIEQLTAYDAAKTSYSYTIVRGPLPVVNYNGTLTLNATPEGKTATLELKPEQAETLARSRQTGTLSLALRSITDAKAVDTRPDDLPNRSGGSIGVVRYGISTQQAMQK